MSLPDAARYTSTIAGSYSGFSVPGIEIYEHDCEGAPLIPRQVDDGDVCRARWVNRQDHGYLTRVNLARANHPNVQYGCPDRGLQCGVSQLHTESHWPDEVSDVHRGYMQLTEQPAEVQSAEAQSAESQSVAGQAREMVAKLRQGAQARAKARAVAGQQAAAQQAAVQQAVTAVQQAVAGNSYMQEQRQRRTWGNHQKDNEDIGAIGIRYISMSGAAAEHIDNTDVNVDFNTDPNHVGLTTEGDFDCLIMAPGHVRCDFYED